MPGELNITSRGGFVLDLPQAKIEIKFEVN